MLGACHVGSRDTKQPRFLEVALALRRLTKEKRASAIGEQQPRRLTGAIKIEAGEESVGIVPLAHAGGTGGRMTTAAEHDNRIGLGAAVAARHCQGDSSQRRIKPKGIRIRLRPSGTRAKGIILLSG